MEFVIHSIILDWNQTECSGAETSDHYQTANKMFVIYL